MCGLMGVRAEVWPVAADPVGLWLISGHDAWRTSGPVMADSSIHSEIENLLHSGGDLPGFDPDRSEAEATAARNEWLERPVPAVAPEMIVTLHSTSVTMPGAGAQWTSWRPDGTSVIHTYMAAIDTGERFARDLWPDACPISPDLLAERGMPPAHGATEEPMPRWLDVPFHGLGHIRWLRDHNGENAAKLGPRWATYLDQFEPVLSKMYDAPHAAAA